MASGAGRPSVADFYRNKSIFITGATGFIGRVLLIKILSSLPDVAKIYVLVRAKKGLSGRQRFAELLQQPPFVWFTEAGAEEEMRILRETSQVSGVNLLDEKLYRPLDWSKVVPVEGDVGAENLGLSVQDRRELCRQVHVVFSLAACVRFFDPIKRAANTNYQSTARLLQLASECPNLVSYLHCSTVAIQLESGHIAESVQPLTIDCEEMAKMIDYLPEDKLKQVNLHEVERLSGSYLLTKSMAENLVQKFEGKLPLAIVRPSATTPSIREPEPGWVDNYYGYVGIMMLVYLGVLRRFPADYNAVVDMSPVDMVANTMIVAAERTARRFPKTIKVYNCCSCAMMPLRSSMVFEVINYILRVAPSIKVLRVPVQLSRNRMTRMDLITGRISELTHACFVDFILMICGQKRFMKRIVDTFEMLANRFEHLFYAHWTASIGNILEAIDELNEHDKKEFNIDLRTVDPKEYLTASMFGSRRHLLKEDLSNIELAKFKFRIQRAIAAASNYVMLGAALWIGLKFIGCSKPFWFI